MKIKKVAYCVYFVTVHHFTKFRSHICSIGDFTEGEHFVPPPPVLQGSKKPGINRVKSQKIGQESKILRPIVSFGGAPPPSPPCLALVGTTSRWLHNTLGIRIRAAHASWFWARNALNEGPLRQVMSDRTPTVSVCSNLKFISAASHLN